MKEKKSLKVWVTGGYFDNSGECFVQEIDVLQETKSDIIRFVPKDHLHVERKGFTGATWIGTPGQSDLLVCGFCSLFRFSPPDWELSGILHQPCMNDLHHVAVDAQNIFVVNTGLEAIDLFDKSGHFIGSYSLHPAWINKERQNGITPSSKDFPEFLNASWKEQIRSIKDTPPTEGYYKNQAENFHQRIIKDFIHLNHVTVLPNQILATSLSNRCVYNLCNFQKVIENTPGHPHDGFIHDNKFWITCVDGTVTAYKIEEGRVTNKIVYSKNFFKCGEHRGWCRGIMIIDNYLLIGITKIQKSTQYEWGDYSWDSTKTGVICWDLVTNKFVSFVDLTEKKLSKIFSIITAGS